MHGIEPEELTPNGDRYLVEIIDIDETFEVGTILVVTPAAAVDQRDPMQRPGGAMEARGVIPAVVLKRGNGHLLGLADWANVVTPGSGLERDLQIVRTPANVPMFYDIGDVVFVDHNARGRGLRILGREVRLVNQIDILAAHDTLRLERDEEGEWRPTRLVGDTWIPMKRNEAGDWKLPQSETE